MLKSKTADGEIDAQIASEYSSELREISSSKQQGIKWEWICDVCGQKGTGSHKYKLHVSLHKKEKLHHCKECDAQFRLPSHLEVHRRTHTGERPYMCNICGAKFTQSSHIKTHMAAHSTSKSHRCDVCQKQFKFRTSLVEHKATHVENAVVYSCEECSKTFLIKRRFDYHMKGHQVQRKILCNLCSRKFKTEYHLQIHQKKCSGLMQKIANKLQTKKNKCAISNANNSEQGDVVIKRSKGRPQGSLGKRNKRKQKKKLKVNAKNYIVHHKNKDYSVAENLCISNDKSKGENEVAFARTSELNAKENQKETCSSYNNLGSRLDNEMSKMKLNSTKDIPKQTDFGWKLKQISNDPSDFLNFTKFNHSGNNVGTPDAVTKAPMDETPSQQSNKVNNVSFRNTNLLEQNDKPFFQQLCQSTSARSTTTESSANNSMNNSVIPLENHLFEPEIPHFPYPNVMAMYSNGPVDPNFTYFDKDLFNFANISNMYDPSFLDIQENAQNLSMSVQDNLDNVPQNLTVLPANEISQQLPAIENIPQNLVVNQNLMNSIGHTVGTSQPSYGSEHTLVQPHGVQSCSRMTGSGGDAPLYIVPENLSSAAHNQSDSPIVINETTRTKENMCRLSSFLNYQNDFSNPQNLTLPNSYQGSMSAAPNIPPQVHDLSIHTQNLSQLGLNEGISCQPENLTMPQNLSANSNNVRRTHCFNQPLKNLSIHTPIQTDLVHRNLVGDNITNQLVPQNLSYSHTHANLIPNALHARQELETMDTSQVTNQGSLSFPQQSYSSNSIVPPSHPLFRNLGSHQFTSNNIPQNLSKFSQTGGLNYQNTPENLSLAAHLEPQNLSYKTPLNYSMNHQINSNFVISQPQNLSVPHNWQ